MSCVELILYCPLEAKPSLSKKKKSSDFDGFVIVAKLFKNKINDVIIIYQYYTIHCPVYFTTFYLLLFLLQLLS